MSGASPILVAGVGNVFFGDDGFGVEVVRRLARRELGARVRLMDAGIAGLHLAYALCDCEAAVLVDAVRRGGAPGTLYVIEPDAPGAAAGGLGPGDFDAHAMDPVKVLRFVHALGGKLSALRVVGCEPGPIGDDVCVELSAPVREAVDRAVPLVERVVRELEDRRA
jgi:hydrogenase maturation protease